MTFRSESRRQDTSAALTLSDLQKGQKVNGRVKKIEDYVEIEGSKLSGLCHKSEVRLSTSTSVRILTLHPAI